MSRRRAGALLALIAAVGVIVVVVVSSRSPTKPVGRAGATYAGATAVRRRNLVVTDTQSGTLSYAGSHTVYNRLSGTITWLPAVGQLIKPGHVLFRVNNRPVLLLDGGTPAYRDLKSTDTAGPDILELNAELVRLGDDPDGIVVDDEWQAATTAGVDALQYGWGERQTGALALGTVVFLPGPQLVSTIEATAGNSVSLTASPAQAEFVSLTTTPTADTTPTTPQNSSTTPTTPTITTPPTIPSSTTPAHRGRPGRPSGGPSQQQQLRALLALLKAEIAQLKTKPSSPQSSSPSTSSPNPSTTPKMSSTPRSSDPSGSNPGASSATAILQTTSDHLIVTVDLAATSQSEAVVGAQVAVQMPAGNTVKGRIRTVSAVATTPSSTNNNGGANNGGSGSATVPVTIALTGPVHRARLDQATVSVTFAQARARHVLSVPVTALIATAGNSYAIQEAAPPHKLIPVTTGLFAGGYVQISGPGIYPGLDVTDSQG